MRNPLFQIYKKTRDDELELECQEEKYGFVSNSENDFTKLQSDDLMNCLMGVGLIRFLEDGWHINVLPK